ncbi:DNA mismatch repair protein mlh1 [Anaeramoeba flamelloides]|uniref:DNA mismatch repair protein mlh1 n=1 Tax=Anaeramoeba flamelloides TaxID=1746091 RepID=A0AAV7Z8Z8_9EUKA|nr:DNA mismatch repair protein mlh1 [Anaeramoeba flamelloides]
MQEKRIKKLSEQVIRKIAVGEVIQRPSSALKERIENSLDAGSTYIKIHLKKEGMNMGSQIGYKAEYKNGELVQSRSQDKKTNQDDQIKIIPVASIPGTQIDIENLFYNQPSRLRSFQKNNQETQKILHIVRCYSINNPQRLAENKKIKIQINKIYKEILKTKDHPCIFLNLILPLECVDVNIHPSKKQVQFLQEDLILATIMNNLKTLLMNHLCEDQKEKENKREEKLNNLKEKEREWKTKIKKKTGKENEKEKEKEEDKKEKDLLKKNIKKKNTAKQVKKNENKPQQSNEQIRIISPFSPFSPILQELPPKNSSSPLLRSTSAYNTDNNNFDNKNNKDLNGLRIPSNPPSLSSSPKSSQTNKIKYVPQHKNLEESVNNENNLDNQKRKFEFTSKQQKNNENTLIPYQIEKQPKKIKNINQKTSFAISVKNKIEPKTLTSLRQNIESPKNSQLAKILKEGALISILEADFELIQYQSGLYLFDIEILVREFLYQTLPVLIPEYFPDLKSLPMFILQLGIEAERKSEQQFFESFAFEIALYYTPIRNTDFYQFASQNEKKAFIHHENIKLNCLFREKIFPFFQKEFIATDTLNEHIAVVQIAQVDDFGIIL